MRDENNAWLWELERWRGRGEEAVLVLSRDFYDRKTLLTTPPDFPVLGFRLSEEGRRILDHRYSGYWPTIQDVLRDLKDGFWSPFFAQYGLTDADRRRIEEAARLLPLLS